MQNCINKLREQKNTKINKTLFLFSDAFFPFTDSLSIIRGQKHKINIYAPMGSKNDSKVYDYVKKYKLNFFKLTDRHFRHWLIYIKINHQEKSIKRYMVTKIKFIEKNII